MAGDDEIRRLERSDYVADRQQAVEARLRRGDLPHCWLVTGKASRALTPAARASLGIQIHPRHVPGGSAPTECARCLADGHVALMHERGPMVGGEPSHVVVRDERLAFCPGSPKAVCDLLQEHDFDAGRMYWRIDGESQRGGGFERCSRCAHEEPVGGPPLPSVWTGRAECLGRVDASGSWPAWGLPDVHVGQLDVVVAPAGAGLHDVEFHLPGAVAATATLFAVAQGLREGEGAITLERNGWGLRVSFAELRPPAGQGSPWQNAERFVLRRITPLGDVESGPPVPIERRGAARRGPAELLGTFRYPQGIDPDPGHNLLRDPMTGQPWVVTSPDDAPEA